MGGMAAPADQIGDVVKLITDIAGRTWRMRWKPCGSAWIGNLRMNSAVASVMIFWRSRPSARSSFHQGGRGNKNSEEKWCCQTGLNCPPLHYQGSFLFFQISWFENYLVY